ncbi:MAG: RecX family transcriptional regulator, partial [Candidatus Doudnabacteria bacterium]|nr:RecX family transcriptional regulator [Candidatus Doudnabacteria bacterium]
MKSAKLQLEEDISQNKAYEYAVFLLGIRLRTEGELREKLRIKPARGGSAFGGNYNDKAINEVIQRLKDQHYIDDQRYAEIFLDNLKKYKSWGYYGIKKKMMEKRLPANIIENVLSEGLSEEEELKIAERYLKKQET